MYHRFSQACAKEPAFPIAAAVNAASSPIEEKVAKLSLMKAYSKPSRQASSHTSDTSAQVESDEGWDGLCNSEGEAEFIGISPGVSDVIDWSPSPMGDAGAALVSEIVGRLTRAYVQSLRDRDHGLRSNVDRGRSLHRGARQTGELFQFDPILPFEPGREFLKPMPVLGDEVVIEQRRLAGRASSGVEG